MMIRKASLSRRTVLRGLGTSLALPWLEAMGGYVPQSKAATLNKMAKGFDGRSPARMAFFYVPNGVHMPDWRPEATGKLGPLPSTLSSLDSFRDQLLVLSGLTQNGGRALGDGAGDHARALGSFLTGTHPVKTDGANIRAGISADQVAADAIGHLTKFRSLELGCDRGAQSGNCDSGYSCAYSSNISWRSESVPNPKEVNPRIVFERLFGDWNADPSDVNAWRRKRHRQSMIDFVLEDVNRLRPRLGSNDQRKVDEYLNSIREVELRIARASQTKSDNPDGTPETPTVNMMTPTGVPGDYREHIRLLMDLLVLAFQTDQTRISTFMYANEGSNRSYGFIEVPEGHHDLSHHGNAPEKQAKIQKINTFHIEQFSYFLTKLRSIDEGDGTLLDHSMIVYGSGLGDGNRHNHDDLPILLAGGGNGSLISGRHIQYRQDMPLNNLYLSLLDRMGVPATGVGDSTARLENLGM
ncbi:MAG: hypothetical protein RJA81_253 [Planctomycetota bacterium]